MKWAWLEVARAVSGSRKVSTIATAVRGCARKRKRSSASVCVMMRGIGWLVNSSDHFVRSSVKLVRTSASDRRGEHVRRLNTHGCEDRTEIIRDTEFPVAAVIGPILPLKSVVRAIVNKNQIGLHFSPRPIHQQWQLTKGASYRGTSCRVVRVRNPIAGVLLLE